MRVVFFLILYSSSVCSQNWQWAGSSGVGGTSGLSLTKDLNGGIIVLASTENPLTGPYTATCDIFTHNILVRYNSGGQIIWQAGFSGTSAYDISCDKIGNTYVVGEFANAKLCSVTNSAVTASQQGHLDAFLAKYDLTGNLKWLKTWGNDSAKEEADVVKVNTAGDILLAGNKHYTSNAGTFNRLYISKFDSIGNAIWTTESGNGNFSPWDITCDNFGNSYVASLLLGSVQIGGTQLNSPFLSPIITKVDNSGNVLWSKQIVTNTSAHIKQIKWSADNHLYIVGTAGAGAQIDGSSLGVTGTFLAKLDSIGQLVWVTQSGTTNGQCLDINSSGDIFVGEIYQGTINMSTSSGVQSFNTLKTEEIIVNKYNNAGSLIWATSLSGTSGYRNSINDIVAREIDVFSTGGFCSQTTFGSFMLNCAQSGFYSTDAFVSKVVDTPPLSTGLFTEYSNTIQILPNPNTGDFNIKFNNALNKFVEVSDLTGRIILSLESDKDLLNVSLKDYANGVYFVKIVSNNTSEIIKVVKQ